MSFIKIGREDLYEKVWSKPITKIAEEYGVSDSMIIKICKNLGVLRPGAGHWAKVAAGKKVRKLPLGQLPKHCQEEYCLTNYEQRQQATNQKVKELQHPLVQQELTDEYFIKVEDKLDDPLPLISKKITSFMVFPTKSRHPNYAATAAFSSYATGLIPSFAECLLLRL